MRRVALVVAVALVAACRAAAHPVREPVVGSPPSSRSPAMPEPVRPPPLAVPILAPPSGQIVALAATPALDAVITADSSDGLRLWPTLDGTREPIVVELPAARTIALARSDAGFIVGLRDDAGGLLVARLDADGRVLARTTFEPDPAVTGLVALNAALLAWRADHTMALYGGDTEVRAELATEPGQRLVTIGATAEGAVAVLDVVGAGDKTRPRARAIVVTDRHLAWGAWLDPGPDVGGRLAVSPGGHYLARLVPAGPKQVAHLSVIDLATGHEVATHGADPRRPLGFLDDAHVVVDGRAAMQVIPVDGTDAVTVPFMRARGFPGAEPFAANHGVAITTSEKQLVILRDGAIHYLGYGYGASATVPAQADGQGGLMVSSPAADGLELVHMDRELDAREVLDARELAGIAALGNDHWVIEQVDDKDGRRANVSILDATTGVVTPTAVSGPVNGLEIRAEPSTALVGLGGPTASLLRYDAHAQTLVSVAAIHQDGFVEPVPVAPALAGGTRLVRVTIKNPLIVEWLRDETAAPASTLEIMGSFAGADRAGHVFVRQPGALIVLANGAQLASIPDPTQRGLWSEPRGTRFVIRTATGIATYTMDGRLRWELALPDVDDVEWLDDDELAIIADGSIARVSVATGKLDDVRCGWEFQLSAIPLVTTGANETLCTRVPPP